MTQIHDKTFRHAMSDLRVAKDFLRHYLPTAIREKIDFDTLSLCKESYIDEELELLITDVLYMVKIDKQNKKSPAFIYILLEHLSAPQKLITWRVLQYTCRIIDQYLKETKSHELPLIIPMVIYNGRVKYPYAKDIYELFAKEERELAKSFMFTNIQLIDFTQIPDEVMRSHQWSSVIELIMKHAFSRDIMVYLESLAGTIQELAQLGADSYILGMLKYVIECSQTRDEKRFKEFLQRTLPKSMEQKAMTLAQLWHDEGFQEGIQKGIDQGRSEAQREMARKLLKTLNDIELVCQITNLSREEINSLKETI